MSCRQAVILALGLCLFAGDIGSRQRVLDSALHHLRSGSETEWSDFSDSPEGNHLALNFTADANREEQTLRLRQRDIKEDWGVFLNGRKLGSLFRDPNDLISYWPLAPGSLAPGNNTLRIAPSGHDVDDVVVGDLRLDDRTRREILAESSVTVQVRTDDGRAVPCRLTIVDANGSLVPLGAESGGHLAVSTGMIYTGDGRATFGIAAGEYALYAGRGFEYSVAQTHLPVTRGARVKLRLQIRREVPVPGYVGCDTHTHTFTYSGHGDASVTDRVLTIAGEGIELAIATDHNILTDYRPFVRRAGVRQHFTTAVGVEVTTGVGHFNVFPVSPGTSLPGPTPPDWPNLFAAVRKIAGRPFVVLNHPRDVHSGFRPFGPEHFDAAAGENRDGWPIEWEGMEVVNSGALQTNPMLLYKDWFALLNCGHRVTPIGASDSHDVGRMLVGQARTYIACPDGDPGRIDLRRVLDSLRRGRVLVSMGLLTDIKVAGRGPGEVVAASADLPVAVSVSGPGWTTADHVTLYADGIKIRETSIPRDHRKGSALHWSGEWLLPKPAHDLYLVAIATGPGVSEPYWRVPKPYQPASPDWTPYVIGSTGPVWVDADADGRLTSAYEYARGLVEKWASDLPRLFAELAAYDRAVAAQAADLLHKRGTSLSGDAVRSALGNAAPAVRQAIEEFAASRARDSKPSRPAPDSK